MNHSNVPLEVSFARNGQPGATTLHDRDSLPKSAIPWNVPVTNRLPEASNTASPARSLAGPPARRADRNEPELSSVTTAMSESPAD